MSQVDEIGSPESFECFQELTEVLQRDEKPNFIATLYLLLPLRIAGAVLSISTFSSIRRQIYLSAASTSIVALDASVYE